RTEPRRRRRVRKRSLLAETTMTTPHEESSPCDTSRPVTKRRLVVVGNGMVGHHLVETASERGLFETFDVTVVSEEACLAYDRVNLSKSFDGAGDGRLFLATRDRYAEVGVS